MIVIGTFQLKQFRGYVWAIWGLSSVAILYCLFVCGMVFLRLLPIWKRTAMNTFSVAEGQFDDFHDAENLSSTAASSSLSASNRNSISNNNPSDPLNRRVRDSAGSYDRFDDNQGFTKSTGFKKQRMRRKSVVMKKRRELSFAVFRIAMYTTIPIICISMVPIFLSIENVTNEFYITAILLLQSLCGVLNFLVFIANPVLDPLWRKLIDKLKAKLGGRNGGGGGPDGNNGDGWMAISGASGSTGQTTDVDIQAPPPISLKPITRKKEVKFDNTNSSEDSIV
ncbi:hypothetical protein H4219_004390 [Mycoemilia scoparia]|uniref:Uncharacterized protein n=1 Tax=Mycoemilia scoparia TaxID=417184 RepID=A0A9W7ZXI6_9FUNG|nr:hypothetical protein H4219_004390 [Mycoemilia scoparia]